MDFTAELPVLRFPLGRAGGNIRLLLWPAFAWRVVAPKPAPRRLDIFERAILGLCRAGIARQDQIAERLMLGPDLVRYIAVGLHHRGLLGLDGQVTPAGNEVLEDDLERPPEESVVGTVFADAFDGQLWPRFVAAELPYVETGRTDGDHLLLLGGTPGDPKPERVFSVYPRRGLRPVQPTAAEVLRAVRSHRRQYQRTDEVLAADAPWLRRVELVDGHATRVWLVVRLRSTNPGWVADDPFGIGQSPAMQERVLERMEENETLRRVMQGLRGEAEVSVDYAALREAAERTVETEFPTSLRDHPELQDRLVGMARALLEADQADAPRDKWDDVAVKAQIALERLMRTIQLGRDPGPALLGLAQDEEFNETLLDSIAASYGFTTPLPLTLSRVRRGKIIHALESGRGSLRPLLLAALLSARDIPTHALRRAAAAAPDLLHRLDRAARLRDPASHDGDTPIQPAEAKIVAQDVFPLVRTLL